MPNKILLIDGSNHAFRMFHAMPKMTAAGKHTGALLGFVNLLKKLENDHKPEAMIVVFDEGASFRVALYPEYKGHRPEMPPELREQWPRFRELVEAWGHPFLAIPGVEADDVIGTLAQRFASPDREVLMVTGDKDYYQLVRPRRRCLRQRARRQRCGRKDRRGLGGEVRRLRGRDRQRRRHRRQTGRVGQG